MTSFWSYASLLETSRFQNSLSMINDFLTVCVFSNTKVPLPTFGLLPNLETLSGSKTSTEQIPIFQYLNIRRVQISNDETEKIGLNIVAPNF